jgi:hypothetical protein
MACLIFLYKSSHFVQICIWCSSPQISEMQLNTDVPLGFRSFLHHCAPWPMLISATLLSIQIHRLSWINWSSCSLSSIGFSVDGHPECLLSALVFTLLYIPTPFWMIIWVMYLFQYNAFVHFSSFDTHWSQNSNDNSMFSLVQSVNGAALLNVQLPYTENSRTASYTQKRKGSRCFYSPSNSLLPLLLVLL